jgi:hypothetical protein
LKNVEIDMVKIHGGSYPACIHATGEPAKPVSPSAHGYFDPYTGAARLAAFFATKGECEAVRSPVAGIGTVVGRRSSLDSGAAISRPLADDIAVDMDAFCERITDAAITAAFYDHVDARVRREGQTIAVYFAVRGIGVRHP